MTVGMSASALSLYGRWPSDSSRLVKGLSSPPPCPSPQPKLTQSPVDRTLTQIKNSGVIACLRASSAEVALEASHAAIAGGISVLEVVMSTPGVFEVLRQLVKEHPAMALGVGTVLRVEDAKTAINAGAKFLMSPAIVKDIMDYVRCCESLYIPGAMTPTEILSAYEAGAKIVKVYPVSALGGVRYISALKKPFAQIPLVASQGITIDSIGEYIRQGASSVVLSDAIFDKKAIGQHNFEKIFELAQSAALLGSNAVNRRKEEL
ncbi:uncharacterized protein LOC129315929 isoform X3 [Prosopis cineraria]|uniref:uncharacterized protein LOC129315929 isoform X3 n=1 Tax=Prosopis cineraria TaxID=364024 RepID=UPI0024106507|nr:uncharacterized protein LOC129315929 isoform X3 [Prosopis cineraria]